MAFELASLRSRLGFSGRAGFWKLLALVFALLNLKSLPFVWHVSAANPPHTEGFMLTF